MHFAHRCTTWAGLGEDCFSLLHSAKAGIAQRLWAEIIRVHSFMCLLVDAGRWLVTQLRPLAGTSTMWPLHVAWAALQYGSWISRVNVPSEKWLRWKPYHCLRPRLRSHTAFLLQYSIHWASHQGLLRFKRRSSSISRWEGAKFLEEIMASEILL